MSQHDRPSEDRSRPLTELAAARSQAVQTSQLLHRLAEHTAEIARLDRELAADVGWVAGAVAQLDEVAANHLGSIVECSDRLAVAVRDRRNWRSIRVQAELLSVAMTLLRRTFETGTALYAYSLDRLADRAALAEEHSAAVDGDARPALTAADIGALARTIMASADVPGFG